VSRISEVFTQLAAQNRKALTCYIVSGDPSPAVTLPAMHKLVADGVDIIELGIPFSDPMAEGPVIQKAHERALVHNTSLSDTLDLVSQFRKTNNTTPIVLMGYANPIERMGYEVFSDRAACAGIDGVLTVDLPPEEAVSLDAFLQEKDIDNIFLVAPTSTDERIASVSKLARGFIYYVSLKGVTGASNLDVVSVEQNVARIRAHTALPVQVGFGIKDAESAKSIALYADGVVVGSALVKLMGQEPADIDSVCSRLEEIVLPIREALESL
jgi:tryptophan synthase alpha chain